MPRKTKEQTEKESKIVSKEIVEKAKKGTTKTATSKTSATKKSTKKGTTFKTTTSKKETPSKNVTSKKTPTTKKSDVKKSEKNKTESKKTPTKKAANKKSATKTTKATRATKTTNTTKKVDSTKKSAAKKSTVKKATSTKKKIEIVEYYDLPYRYNQTIVRVLAQTPTNLFIYWDISDKDRRNFEKQYGENFFENSRPILIIHNNTLGYSFEVEINDFANSWYLSVADAKCDYKIELGRRPIFKTEKLNTDYIYITTSNEIEAPNDRILYDKNQKMVYFKNVKTGQISRKRYKFFIFY